MEKSQLAMRPTSANWAEISACGHLPPHAHQNVYRFQIGRTWRKQPKHDLSIVLFLVVRKQGMKKAKHGRKKKKGRFCVLDFGVYQHVPVSPITYHYLVTWDSDHDVLQNDTHTHTHIHIHTHTLLIPWSQKNKRDRKQCVERTFRINVNILSEIAKSSTFWVSVKVEGPEYV